MLLFIFVRHYPIFILFHFKLIIWIIEIIYSVILRLRGIYLIKCILQKKNYSKKDFLKYLENSKTPKKEIQEIYRILYQKNYNVTQALGIIEAEMEATPERDEIIDFIRNSSRGVMKGYSGNY